MHHGIPVSETNLTPAERALLPDPDWVTEDDANAIIGMRRERERARRYSLEEVPREKGCGPAFCLLQVGEAPSNDVGGCDQNGPVDKT